MVEEVEEVTGVEEVADGNQLLVAFAWTNKSQSPPATLF